MAKLLLRNIRSGKRKALITDVFNITIMELKSEMDPIRKALVKQFDSIVSNWKSDVSFGGKVFIQPDAIFVNVFPKGADKKIWDYVDQGTPPHTITGSPLIFRSGYQPKTLANPPRVALSGGGKATGPWVKKYKVNHPGVTARNFTPTISKDYVPFFQSRIEAAFKRVERKVNKM